MKKSIWTVAITSFFIALAGTASADTLSGKITNVNPEGNSLTLATERSASTEPAEHKLVWEDNQSEAAKLETSRVGDHLTVDAEQNPISRNWNVKTIRGPLADAEKQILRTDDQTISGEIQNIDTAGNSLTLTEKNASGQPVEFHVVWDDANAEVANRLDKHKVGDHLTLTADQNKVTQNWKAKSISGPMETLAQPEIQTLTGEVKSVDADKNFIVLNSTDPSGKQVERRIVWDNDFKQLEKLENMKIGEHLSVRADQNILTRNWKVQAIS